MRADLDQRTQGDLSRIVETSTIRRPFWVLLCLLGCASSARSEAIADTTAAPSVLTNAAQVLAVGRDEARQGLPVRLRGMVTLYRRSWQLFFLQDSSGGVYLFGGPERPGLRAGQWIEVRGRTQEGRVSTIVFDERVRALEPGEVPAAALSPRRVELADLADARVDCQWVEFEAVARRVELKAPQLLLEFGPESARVLASVPWSMGSAADREFLWRRVRIRGVCTFEPEGTRMSPRVYASSEEDLRSIPAGDRQVLEPANRTLGELRRDPPRGDEQSLVRVQGVVTFAGIGVDGYIQDGTVPVAIRTLDPRTARVGDRVEVTGFGSASGWPARIEDVQVRNLGPGQSVEPAPVDNLDGLQGENRGRLVTLEGRLIDPAEGGATHGLTLLTAGALFDAEFSEGAPGFPEPLQPGSRVRVTGIGLGSDAHRAGSRPRVLLRSLADVQVLGLPTWWTLSHILGVVGALGATSLVAMAWALTLRHQVARQTAQIRQQWAKEAELERRYRDLIEEAQDAIWTMDPEGTLLTLNRAAEQLLGRSRGEAVGRKLAEFVTAGTQSACQGLLESGDHRDSGRVHELTLPGDGSGERVVEVTSRPFDRSGRSSATLAIARDVTERRRAAAELHRLQRELIRASRQAGMAEVATDVLHNVGNVLNSANVSITLLQEREEHSIVGDVDRLAELLAEHHGDLDVFLTEDRRGRLIPDFLAKVAQGLDLEREERRRELEQLRHGIDHVKEIVALQQQHASASGVVEKVAVAEVLEQALRLDEAGLAEHRVEVRRRFSAVPDIYVDKHRLLSILINLIVNARHALAASTRCPRVLTVEVAPRGPERVALVVSDNGVGIAPENLTRVFNHGFTTRKDGHGFGLHNGANSAREMGGNLSAASEGPGFGATFTLELPVPGNSAPGRKSEAL